MNFGKNCLNLIGVGEKASTIAVVGVTLGIGFGGGLLIQVKSRIKYKDVFGVITLIGMLHSIVEDTGLVSLMGANIFITLFLRFFLTLFCVYIILRVFSDYPEEFWKKHLVNDNIP